MREEEGFECNIEPEASKPVTCFDSMDDFPEMRNEEIGKSGRNGRPGAHSKGQADIKLLASSFSEAFFLSRPPAPALKPRPRQRRKLWEMPADWHCLLVGTCLTMADLRQLAKRALIEEPGMSDYTLHARVVKQSCSRTEIAESLQRLLDQRHVLSIRRFSKAKDGTAVLRLWQEALATDNIPGGLWAAWTHREITEFDGTCIYGDLHMLSHQLGAQDRADQRRLRETEQDNAQLRQEAATLMQSLITAHREHERRADYLNGCIAGYERQLARFVRGEIVLIEARGGIFTHHGSGRE